MKDKISIERLKKIHPDLQLRIKSAIEEVEKNIPDDQCIRIVQGYRSLDEQAALYAQGRTTKGPIVTNAPAGYSWHNFHKAIDIAILIKSGKDIDWSETNPYFIKLRDLLIADGAIWGGNFSTITDFPHFEWHLGKTLAEEREEAGI